MQSLTLSHLNANVQKVSEKNSTSVLNKSIMQAEKKVKHSTFLTAVKSAINSLFEELVQYERFIMSCIIYLSKDIVISHGFLHISMNEVIRC